MAAHIELAKRGVEVINIEPFDYAKFYAERLEYLHRTFDTQTVEYYLTKSNLMHVAEDIPSFLELVRHETRRATIEDIQNFLNQGYLVGAEINSRILNRLPGFSLHYVLITDYHDNEFVLNDPGGGSTPPMEQRRVPKSDFIDALGKGRTNGEVTGFRMKGVKI